MTYKRLRIKDEVTYHSSSIISEEEIFEDKNKSYEKQDHHISAFFLCYFKLNDTYRKSRFPISPKSSHFLGSQKLIPHQKNID